MTYTFDNWLADLRSGEYEQTRDKLCEFRQDGPPAFCCLGLLEHKLGRLVDGADCDTGDREAPPSTVSELLGLPLNGSVLRMVNCELRADRVVSIDPYPVFNPKVIVFDDGDEWECPAAEANDEGYSFEQIADGLERARERGLY